MFIRLTDEEHTDIVQYAENHDLTITQTLVQGFKTLKENETVTGE